jgi:hypothetical protein
VRDEDVELVPARAMARVARGHRAAVAAASTRDPTGTAASTSTAACWASTRDPTGAAARSGGARAT